MHETVTYLSGGLRVYFEKGRKQRNLPAKDWASCGHQNKRKPNVINSLYLQSEELEKHNIKLEKKYKEIEENDFKLQSEKYILSISSLSNIDFFKLHNINCIFFILFC